MAEMVLDIQGVKKSFAIRFQAGRKAQTISYRNVLDGLDICLKRGEVTALIGGNGAGKTTLFNIVSGLVEADEGSIIFQSSRDRIECTSARPWVIARAGMGRLFQGAKIFGGCTVTEHIYLHATPQVYEWPFSNLLNGKKIRQANDRTWSGIYEKLGAYDGFAEILSDPSRPAASLSFAQQRLLALAGLVAGDYDLLLLDELSSGMSPELFPAFIDIFKGLKSEGKSLFLIEHNVDFVSEVADKSYYIEEGRVKYAGPPEEVLEKEEVKRSYLL